jgi:hypothetical protein
MSWGPFRGAILRIGQLCHASERRERSGRGRHTSRGYGGEAGSDRSAWARFQATNGFVAVYTDAQFACLRSAPASRKASLGPFHYEAAFFAASRRAATLGGCDGCGVREYMVASSRRAEDDGHVYGRLELVHVDVLLRVVNADQRQRSSMRERALLLTRTATHHFEVCTTWRAGWGCRCPLNYYLDCRGRYDPNS